MDDAFEVRPSPQRPHGHCCGGRNDPGNADRGRHRGRLFLHGRALRNLRNAGIEGMPDHRDSFLGRRGESDNKVMMICCSRSKTPVLVLDL